MPTYEMPVLMRVMQKPENVAVMKRIAQAIFNTGGFIRKIEHLGLKDLPCKTNAHGQNHWKATQVFFYFDVPPSSLQDLAAEYRRDMDIVRATIFKINEPKKIECTLHEELLPPPYRPEVQEMLRKAKKQENKKKVFQYNSGLDYYPFQK